MAKGAKRKANGGGVQNRPAYSRISFLYQAAALLATTRQQPQRPSVDNQNAGAPASENNGDRVSRSDAHVARADGPAPEGSPQEAGRKGGDHCQQQRQLLGMSRRLLSDLRSVSLKNQIRLSPAVKRTVCKFCDTLLVEGRSCTSTVENGSRGARKPWADVLVITCGTCGGAKRFPVAAPRQKRRPFRAVVADKEEKTKAAAQDTRTPDEQLSG